MADVAPMTPKKALYAGHLSVTAFADIVYLFISYLIKIICEIELKVEILILIALIPVKQISIIMCGDSVEIQKKKKK